MKLSTINTIYWIALAVFWGLLIGDLVTPGEEPKILNFIGHVSVYVFLSAQFYIMGVKRGAKKTTYEMSK